MYNILSVILCTLALIIVYLAYVQPNENLEISSSIYNEIVNNGVNPQKELLPQNIKNIESRLKKHLKNNDRNKFKMEVYTSYLLIRNTDKIATNQTIFNCIKILRDAEFPEMLLRFFLIANYSDNLALLAYSCSGNEKIMKYINTKEARTILKEYPKIRMAFLNARILMTEKNISDDRIEKIFYHIGTHHFNVPYKIKPEHRAHFSYPLIASIYKIIGDTNRYEQYKNKSLNNEQMKNMNCVYWDYMNVLIKSYILCEDYDIAVNAIDSLPNCTAKDVLIRRVIRELISTESGMRATEKSEFIKKIKNSIR